METTFMRNFKLSGITITCPFCENEMQYSVEQAYELVGDLWYPQTAEVECTECGKTFVVNEGEDDF
jgi:endogenous inhibitor of DNA gyrase (YacG/DUF329 family)